MMQKYNRQNDSKNEEERAGREYSNSRGYNRSRNDGRPKKPRDWTPPSYLDSYGKSAWLMKTFNGRHVERREYDSNDSMIRRFKKVVEAAGILKELKRREYYLTPSQNKRDKKKRALKRLRKRLKLEADLVAVEERQELEKDNPQYSRGTGDA